MDNESTQSDNESETTRLIEVLKDLEAHIQRQNSLKYAFIKGMIHGLGTVIGATVLVALFGGIIIATINIITDSNIDKNSLEKAIGQ